jgi:cardiolipin synthase
VKYLPNLLTILRVWMLPFIAMKILGGDYRQAFYILLLAGFTDALDGYLARRFHWESEIGAMIDPIADKLLLSVTFIMLGLVDLVPGWLVWIVIGRDLLLLAATGCVMAFTPLRGFPPSPIGKASTALQLLTVAAVLLSVPPVWLTGLFFVVAALAIASGGQYLMSGAQRLRSGV